MGRIRSIHPDACISETLASISAEQERTFWRLLTCCDDEGRALANVKLLKSSLYPMHEDVSPADVDKDLIALEKAGLIRLYHVAEKRYLEVRSWNEYQHPKKPTPSKFPNPPTEVPHQFPTSSPPEGEGFPQEKEKEKEKEKEVGGGEGGTTTPPPAGGGSPPAAAGRRPRAGRSAGWHGTFPVPVVEASVRIMAFWPDPKRGDLQPGEKRQPVPVSSPPELARRLLEISRAGASLEVCVAIAQRAVAEWEDGKWIKAAERFFGKAKDAPWDAYYQAHVTNAASAQAAEPLAVGAA